MPDNLPFVIVVVETETAKTLEMHLCATRQRATDLMGDLVGLPDGYLIPANDVVENSHTIVGLTDFTSRPLDVADMVQWATSRRVPIFEHPDTHYILFSGARRDDPYAAYFCETIEECLKNYEEYIFMDDGEKTEDRNESILTGRIADLNASLVTVDAHIRPVTYAEWTAAMKEWEND